MSVTNDGVIWMNGELVERENAKVSVLSHGLHYGTGVFEGIRCYKTSKGAAVFRLEEHIKRLLDSAKIMMMRQKYTVSELMSAVLETINANNLDECYIRPIITLGDGGLGIATTDAYPIEVIIAAWKWGAYLGDEALSRGIKVKTSSYTRFNVNSIPIRSKTCGNYVTSVLAKREANISGYDEALFLDTDGFVAEGTGENIFIIKDGVLITTPLTSVLKGITRDTVLEIARDLNFTVKEQLFTRDDVYVADEAFFTGTAAEITPISMLDNRLLGTGSIGPITKKIQSAYFGVVNGSNRRYSKWLTVVK